MSRNDGRIEEDLSGITTTDSVGGDQAGIKGEPPGKMKAPTKNPLKTLKQLKKLQNDFKCTEA